MAPAKSSDIAPAAAGLVIPISRSRSGSSSPPAAPACVPGARPSCDSSETPTYYPSTANVSCSGAAAEPFAGSAIVVEAAAEARLAESPSSPETCPSGKPASSAARTGPVDGRVVVSVRPTAPGAQAKGKGRVGCWVWGEPSEDGVETAAPLLPSAAKATTPERETAQARPVWRREEADVYEYCVMAQ
ncbi:hypothetical protein HYH03_010734 [Edaphochlamys debaryana]|uniref:Uncharacterized protein n=1 Tax=Edaphochlamys debaryana TaxID=47281 RepID=A0A836BWB6_9CHLO|nr:hypothetical protein HYH03_010734 [Edaphochlamys debaryana]|eukprot:KAG2490812.1 hypothetical protein HYH03_010734 [Edaphochlamys debaryana]